jgi:DHA1 family inner membrane transport protein
MKAYEINSERKGIDALNLVERPGIRTLEVREKYVNASTTGLKDRMPLALWALAICAFCIGTGEFVVAGLLLNVAGDLKVSTSSAGFLVTGYALGVVLGAPFVTVLTRQLPRKAGLLVLIGLIAAGDLICAVAPNYVILLAARVITGLAHAAFFGMGSVIAAELAPSGKQASAIAIMFTGVTLAYVLGVPLGTLIGQEFGWRFTFWAVTIFGALAIISIIALVPRMSHGSAPSLRQELRVIGRPQVLLAFAMTTFGNGSVVTVLTYIAPILVKVTGFNERAVSPILLLFGIGFVVGNNVGGRLADRWLMPSLLGILIMLGAVLAGFTATSHDQGATLVTVFLFGVAAFGMVPGLQLRVVDKAEGAPNLASVFNIASFNLGSAGGAYLGGLILDSKLGLNAVPWVGALVTAAGIAVTAFSWSLDHRTRS